MISRFFVFLYCSTILVLSMSKGYFFTNIGDPFIGPRNETNLVDYWTETLGIATPPLLWLRADYGITDAGAGAVSAWADQSGTEDANKNHVQATINARPTLASSDADFNGQACLVFDGNDALRSGAWTVPPSQPVTFFAVARSSGALDNRVIIDGRGGGERNVLYMNTSGNVSMYAASAVASSTSINGTTRAVCGVFNGATSALYVDSSAVAAASGDAGAWNITGTGIGSQFGNSSAEFWSGKIAEIIAVAGAADATLRGKVFTYFGARYTKAWS
jgi:hypothetical protein